MKEESELKNSIVRNEESFPEIFGMTKSEVLELFKAIREYHTEANTPSSYKDWCKMYPGIHREGTGEIAQRNWLACFRWLRTKGRLKDRPTPVVETKTAEEIMQDFDLINQDGDIEASFKQVRDCINAYHAQFTPSAKSVEVEDFQSHVLDWLIKCFGIEISKDVIERSDRFLEESLELAQSLNYTPDRAHALVDYVFSRDKGEPFQECGGVMVTLAALCSATGLNMAMDGEMEFARINKPEIIEKIRKKQASKPTGSALPQVWQQQKQADTISQLTESLKTIYSLAKPGSAIYDICDKTLNQK